MYSIFRKSFIFIFSTVVLIGAESHIPRLYSYHTPVPEVLPTARPDVFVLDDMLIVGTRYRLSPYIQRDLERTLDRGVLDFSKHRIELIPDVEDGQPASFAGERVIPMRGTSDRLDLKLRDVFLIDLPGGGVLKAQFRSGLSIQLDSKTKLILRPSRNKLVSIRVDW